MSKISNIVGYIISRSIECGFNVKLIHDKVVEVPPVFVGGYLDAANKELVCATKKPQREWLEILIHEFCHLQQFKENPNKFLSSGNYEFMVDRWLERGTRPSPKVIHAISMIRNLELDCEKKVVRELKRFHLNNIDSYIQKANAYIFFYTALPIIRKWSKPGKASYNIPQILDIMPKTFCKNYDNPPNGFVHLLNKYCL